MTPPAIHHLAIQVTDLVRVERFYRDTLALPVLRRWPRADGSGDRSVWLTVGGDAFLALESVPHGEIASPDERPGFHLLALKIARPDRHAWVRRLEAAGHPIYRRTPYTIYVRDPEGNRIGLSHWPDAHDDADDSL